MSEFLQGFARDFAALDKHNLERLSQLYSDDIRFTAGCTRSPAKASTSPWSTPKAATRPKTSPAS